MTGKARFGSGTTKETLTHQQHLVLFAPWAESYKGKELWKDVVKIIDKSEHPFSGDGRWNESGRERGSQEQIRRDTATSTEGKEKKKKYAWGKLINFPTLDARFLISFHISLLPYSSSFTSFSALYLILPLSRFKRAIAHKEGGKKTMLHGRAWKDSVGKWVTEAFSKNTLSTFKEQKSGYAGKAGEAGERREFWLTMTTKA